MKTSRAYGLIALSRFDVTLRIQHSCYMRQKQWHAIGHQRFVLVSLEPSCMSTICKRYHIEFSNLCCIHMSHTYIVANISRTESSVHHLSARSRFLEEAGELRLILIVSQTPNASSLAFESDEMCFAVNGDNASCVVGEVFPCR